MKPSAEVESGVDVSRVARFELYTNGKRDRLLLAPLGRAALTLDTRCPQIFDKALQQARRGHIRFTDLHVIHAARDLEALLSDYSVKVDPVRIIPAKPAEHGPSVPKDYRCQSGPQKCAWCGRKLIEFGCWGGEPARSVPLR